MARERKVVVQGGGKNLYRVNEASGKYHVYHVNVGFIENSTNPLGSASSLEDALAIIRSHSGREIKEIS